MSGEFEGAVAIVTGGSRGIGAGVCDALRARGARVASLARTRSEVATLSLECDVTREDDVRRAVGEVERKLGRVKLLVCSAGIVVERPVADLSLEDWRRVVDTSLTGTFLACRAVVPSMRAGGGGRMVALSSGYARKGYRNGAPYAAAKAGVEALVRSLALEVAGDDITVNAVAPGPIETKMIERVKADAERLRRTVALIPQGRIGNVNDVVGPVLFLLSDSSRYVTGQVLHVNGGMLMP